MQHSLVRQLLGKWVSDPDDIDSLSAYDRVSLEFKEDGQLIYTIHTEKTDQILLLTYDVQDGVLVTDQPSMPGEERTGFSFTDDGKLQLKYDETMSAYVREA